MQKEIFNDELVLTNYKMRYTLKEPSRTSDYDYDPDAPNRRFISTYVHELEILDKITDNQLIKINFASDTCGLLLSALYRLNYTNSQDGVRTLRNIYLDGITAPPALLSIVKHDDGAIQSLTFTLLHPKKLFSFDLSLQEASYLINLLESDEINEMYDFK